MMAAIATANLAVVGFDLSYVALRDFWLRGTVGVGPVSFQVPLPPVTRVYDPVKGIEPHRDTEQYLSLVSDLKTKLPASGIASPEVEAQLKLLRDESAKMIEGNWFEGANKSGNLEKIKNRFRDRLDLKSSRQAFETFWSQDYLSKKGVDQEIKFFDEKIRPLISTNYYRSIGENGLPTDHFWLLDMPFVWLFGLEFLARTFYLTRRNKERNLKWLDAMLWRWYDVLFLIPVWQWLRVIPVAIRLDQSEVIRLDRIRDQATRGFVTNIAEELIQSANRPYQDLNRRDEVREIIDRVLQVTVKQALPKVKPDLEAVIRHALEGVLETSPIYKGFKSVPLMGAVPAQLNEQLVSSVTAGAYDALVKVLDDQVAAELVTQFVKNLARAIVEEVQEGDSIEELQSLLTDLMEEVKVNYVQQGSGESAKSANVKVLPGAG
jgi:hypothetical protein